MKYNLFIVLLLTATIAHAQSDAKAKDSTPVLGGMVESRMGFSVGTNNVVFLQRTGNYDKKMSIDSGIVEITGDTIQCIRSLAKQLDSLFRRKYEEYNYVNEIIRTADSAIVCIPRPEFRGSQLVDVNEDLRLKRVDAYIAAIRRWQEFMYGKPNKKHVKHSK